MEYDGIVVELGQVWYHRDMPEYKYQIVEIVVERYTDAWGTTYEYRHAYAAKYVDGKQVYPRGGFGELTSKNSPSGWMSNWVLDKSLKTKKFSHVNPRALRKRMREQLAAQFLTGQNES